jgi:hypothetical protein
VLRVADFGGINTCSSELWWLIVLLLVLINRFLLMVERVRTWSLSPHRSHYGHGWSILYD